MKVLWFEITEPYGYNQKKSLVGGWQDALEPILSSQDDVELFIAFETPIASKPTKKDRVHYIPLFLSKSLSNKIKSKFSWTYNAKIIISKMLNIIKDVQPDIIHIFGTEWPYGLVAEHTTVPIVIHIQGSIVECNKYTYPPKYSFFSEACASLPNFLLSLEILLKPVKDASRLSMEKRIWKVNSNYMGRTQWDKNLSSRMHPNRNYYHVDEALRSDFIKPSFQWTYTENECISLISNGCASFWKGPNILLQSAKILKDNGQNFKWFVIGEMPPHLKSLIEKKEKTTFEKNNIHFLGWQTAKQIQERMSKATFYIHCSYIDNSPNSICEAQAIGIPIISTNAGGISSLIEHNKTGFLVSTNEPQEIANMILSLNKKENLLKKISQASITTAQARHNKENILSQLLNCYKAILNSSKEK